jgi:voltage-gated potassium channel
MGGTEKRRLARSQDAYDRFAAAVDTPLMVITILWLPILLIPLVSPVHGSVAETFAIIDYTVWALFVLEYGIKMYLTPARGRYFRTHLLDLLIVAVPFFRPARVGRLLNVGRLARIGVVVDRGIQRAKTVMTHRGVHFVLLAVALIVFACAGLVTIAEHSAKNGNIHNFGQGLWWAMVTVTTVGYGDRYPTTPFGQGVAVVLMLVGIGLIGVLTATVASYFVGQDLDKAQGEREAIREELELARIERDSLHSKLDTLQSTLTDVLAHLANSDQPTKPLEADVPASVAPPTSD